MKSIQGHLRTAIVAGMLLPSTLLFGGIFMFVRDQYVEFFEQALRDDLHTVANMTQVHPSDEVYANVEPEALPQYLADGTRFFQVWETADLRLIDRSGSLEQLGVTLAHPGVVTATPQRYEAALPDGRGVSLIAFKSRANWSMDRDELEHTSLSIRDHDVHIVAGRLRAELDRPLRWLALVCLAGTLVVPLMAGLIVAAAAPGALAPLRRFGDAMAKRSARSVRLLALGEAQEVRAIGAAFGKLMQRIARSRAQERESVISVARDLRAAVAELQSRAEVALVLPGADARDAVRGMQEALQRISGLVAVLPHPLQETNAEHR